MIRSRRHRKCACASRRTRRSFQRACSTPGYGAPRSRTFSRAACARRYRQARAAAPARAGLITIDAGNQEVLERTAVVVTTDWVEARIEVGLPAAGRTILGREAEAILVKELPEIVERALLWDNVDDAAAREFVEAVTDYDHVRRALDDQGLVAFIADGAVLPREKRGVGPADGRRRSVPIPTVAAGAADPFPASAR